MFRSNFLIISNDVLDLLSEFLLDLRVVDEAKYDDAEGGGGRVEPGEEEEDGGGHEADFKVFLGEEKILVFFVQLFNEDVNDVIPLYKSWMPKVDWSCRGCLRQITAPPTTHVYAARPRLS